MRFYAELKLRKKTKDIKDFEIKPKFELQPAFKSNEKKIRAITIIPDFQILHNDGTKEIVDTKGIITKDWAIKWKMLKFIFKNDNNVIFSVL